MLKRIGLLMLAVSSLCMAQSVLAPTPPMGWNSWDSYGLTINEAQFKANVVVMAKRLKPAGYEYAVVDEGWYLENPQKKKEEKFVYRMDANGRYEPALSRFASAAGDAGFSVVSRYVHARGLKFGIHIIRGIPKDAVEKNLPIAGSAFYAKDAADVSDTCPWNPDNYGVKDTAAGQAWYDSLMRQYAAWGVDYIKVDCIASHPYKGDEIRMIHRAIVKSGRAMVLSLSPGPAPLEKAEELAANAQLWRISDDVWDLWTNSKSWPQSVKAQFDVIASWQKHVRLGSWPDADMLAVGMLGPVPGWGEPRKTRLTENEQRTLVTLWAIARSPLFIGANLTELDDWTAELLTNADVIRVNQMATASRMAGRDGNVIAWTADLKDGSHALALFNLGDAAVTVMTKSFASYGLTQRKSYRVRDVWAKKDLGLQEDAVSGYSLAPHGCALWMLRP
jgi:alpha-galactosidase